MSCDCFQQWYFVCNGYSVRYENNESDEVGNNYPFSFLYRSRKYHCWAITNSSAGLGKVKDRDGPAGCRKLTSTSSVSRECVTPMPATTYYRIDRWRSQLFLALVALSKICNFYGSRCQCILSIVSPTERFLLSLGVDMHEMYVFPQCLGCLQSITKQHSSDSMSMFVRI